MTDSILVQVEEAQFALALVDRTAEGYSDTWLAPGGKTVDEVVLADYADTQDLWVCQISKLAVTARANTRNVNVKPTGCAPGRTITVVDLSNYQLELDWYQDITVRDGLSAYTFEHDAAEAYFLAGLDGPRPPKSIGRCRLVAGAFGGNMRTPLESSAQLTISGRPQYMIGTQSSYRVVPPIEAPEPPGPPTGVTAGAPGAFTPGGSALPANLAALNLLGALGQTDPWTEGQYVVLGDASSAHWDGEDWVAGAAPGD